MQGCRHPSVFPASPPSFRHPLRHSGFRRNPRRLPGVVCLRVGIQAHWTSSPPSSRHPLRHPGIPSVMASPPSSSIPFVVPASPPSFQHPLRRPGIPSVVPHPLRHPGIPSVIPASPPSFRRKPDPLRRMPASWRKGALDGPPVFPAKAGIHVAPPASVCPRVVVKAPCTPPPRLSGESRNPRRPPGVVCPQVGVKAPCTPPPRLSVFPAKAGIHVASPVSYARELAYRHTVWREWASATSGVVRRPESNLLSVRVGVTWIPAFAGKTEGMPERRNLCAGMTTSGGCRRD